MLWSEKTSIRKIVKTPGLVRGPIESIARDLNSDQWSLVPRITEFAGSNA